MLGFAVLITVAGQCIVDITLTNALSPQLATFGIWITLLWTGAHLAVRRWAPYADPLLLPAVALLVGLGLTMIHRLDLGGSASTGGTGAANDARTQLVWATLGVAVFVVVLVGVRDRITAADQADARRILTALRDERLPVCPSPGQPATTTGGAAGSTSPTTAATPTASGSPAAPTSPSVGAGTTAVTSTFLPTSSAVRPGVDCREAK
jgi:hypothetical protein